MQVMIRFWWFIYFLSEFSRSANTFSFSKLLLNSCRNFYQQPPNCSSVRQHPTSVHKLTSLIFYWQIQHVQWCDFSPTSPLNLSSRYMHNATIYITTCLKQVVHWILYKGDNYADFSSDNGSSDSLNYDKMKENSIITGLISRNTM